MLDLLYNLMLESTGRLQKCRIYEMTDNKTARSTISYLIVRDQAHENAYAKALETLGVNWGKVLPIPKTNAEQFPEVKKLLDQGLQSKQYTFDADSLSEAGKIFRGMSPVEGRRPSSTPPSRRPTGVPIDDRRRAARGVLARAGPRPARADPGHGRAGAQGRRRAQGRGEEVAVRSGTATAAAVPEP